ncbi:MAG: enoyl-CoA hydratase/isomerase family protein [Gammaproteobacteria bacterium]|nr:enoyl-CoA hydratase/isomerase family protein [Gammaproteobacteria bacterium]
MIRSTSIQIRAPIVTVRNTNRAQVAWPSTQLLDLRLDDATSALWVTLRASAAYCVTEQLLKEFNSVSRAVSQLPLGLIKYRVLTSDLPGVFSLGGDLAHFVRCIELGDHQALLRYGREAVHAIWRNAASRGQHSPTSVALVHGEAQGGGFEAALSCHVLVAEKGAFFGFPESLFGMFPGMGAFQLLAIRSDASLARKLIGSSNRYPAELLAEMGIIDVLVEKGKGRAAVHEILAGSNPDFIDSLRTRFTRLKLDDLTTTVSAWVDCAMALEQKSVRAMRYLLGAQAARAARLQNSTGQLEEPSTSLSAV